MQSLLILGAGFAGLAAASELEPLAEKEKLDVTLIDSETHFSMGFSKVWILFGRRKPNEGRRAYSQRTSRHVKFINDEITGIDPTNKRVHTHAHQLNYDYLIVSLGTELTLESPPGLKEEAFNLYDLPSVTQLKPRIEALQQGTVLVLISSVPFKCPPAPYEYAFLFDDMLRNRGIRDKVRVVVTTPEPQPMPVAGKAVGDAVKQMLTQHNIEYFPNAKPKQVDPSRHVVAFENIPEIEYSLLTAIPTHRAPKVVRDARLTDASGFIPVNLNTFETSTPGIYAVGDIATLKLPNGNPHPKAGIFAEAQGTFVARKIASELGDGTPLQYSGSGICYVETGEGMAAAAEAHLITPEGPRFNLGTPSQKGLRDKQLFESDHFRKWFGG